MEDGYTLNAWLALAVGLPPASRLLQRLRQQYPDVQELSRRLQTTLGADGLPEQDGLLSLLKEARPGGLTNFRSTTFKRSFEQAKDWAANDINRHIISLSDPRYPTPLAAIADAPPVLFVTGRVESMQIPCIAMVGSRKSSQRGIALAHRWSGTLASAGWGVVSGLARGIDAAAHQGALDANGLTLAVSATSPETIYPRHHRQLAQQIVDTGGLLVTEMPLDQPIQRWHFPLRNRIVSGLCLGVLVVEAGARSGTLSTATQAIEQGREVMAVPGSIGNSDHLGCHALIKQGAALVESCEEVIQIIDSARKHWGLVFDVDQSYQTSLEFCNTVSMDVASQSDSCYERLSLQARLLHYLSHESATVDELTVRFNQSAADICAQLGQLEINGQIVLSAGGRYARC